jgi:hypothetical protein
MEKVTERRFLMLICIKEQERRPSTCFNWGKAPLRNDPDIAHNLPCEGDGEGDQSGGGRSLAVAGPLLVPLSHPLL